METIDDNMQDQNYEHASYTPDAGSSFSNGWNVLRESFVTLLVITIIYMVLDGPMATLQWGEDNWHWFIAPIIFFGILYGLFVAGPVTYGVHWTFLKTVRGERVEVGDIFEVFRRNYLNAVFANLVVSIIIGFGIMLLIVPGIIFACRLAFVPYLVVDERMDVMDALNVSWNMTRGYGWQIFFMGLISFFVVILGLIALFVGVVISVMWIEAAFASMYHAVASRDGIPEVAPR